MRATPNASRSQIATARAQSRATWGTTVRRSVDPIRRSTFNRAWVDRRINLFPQRWFYWHRSRPVYWWWRWSTWSAINAWIVYDNWSDPFYYDFGYNPYYVAT